MKLILATPIYPPDIGGPAIYSQKLKEGLAERGHQVKVVSYHGLKIYPQPLRIFIYFLKVLKASRGCNLIYAFNLISCGLPACSAAKILKKKLVIRIGGDFLWERAVEQGRTKKPLREYYLSQKTLKERFWIWLMNRVFSRTNRAIFTSAFQRDIYLKHFNIKEEKTIIIENPFPGPDFKKTLVGEFSNKYQFLWAVRIIKLKNLSFLIRAFENVLQRTDKNLTLKIIGSGPERKNLKVGQNIIFSAPVSQKELLKEIKQSYLCVLPSLTEITPNFALECIRLQKPILLTKETSYYETLGDHLIFINPQDEKDLIEKIIHLLDERNYLNYIESIKRIPINRTWDNVVEEHEKSFIHRSN